ELIAPQSSQHQRLFFDRAPAPQARGTRLAGAKIDTRDRLAVLHHGKAAADAPSSSSEPADVITEVAPEITGPENTVAVAAPMQGTIVSIDVSEGDSVHRGQQLFVMEAMKMEHVIKAHVSGIVRQIAVAKGDAVFEGHPLAFIEERDVESAAADESAEVDLDRIRPDLAEVHERHKAGLDA